MNAYFVGIETQGREAGFLYRRLADHPEVAFCSPKEMHYFDSAFGSRDAPPYTRELTRRIRRAIEEGRDPAARRLLEQLQIVSSRPSAYREHLETARTAGVRVVGDLTPGYAALTLEAFVRMREILSGPPVVCVLRDPIERCRVAGRAALADPDAAIRWARIVEDRSDYATIVPLLDQVFGEDVLYLFYENRFESETLGRLTRHLGVSETWDRQPDAAPPVGSTNVLPTPAAPAEVGDYLARQYAFMSDRFDDLPRSWHHLSHGGRP